MLANKAILSSKKLVLLQFIICTVIVFSQGMWCHWFSFFKLDYCWLVQANLEELRLGFPNYHNLVQACNVFLDLGLFSFSLVLVLVRFRKEVGQNLVLVTTSVLLTLFLAEYGLRQFGWIPGQFQYSVWLSPVREVVDIKGFVADENGIFKVDTAEAFRLKQEIQTETTQLGDVSRGFLIGNISQELVSVFEDHLPQPQTTKANSKFARRIVEIRKKEVWNSFDSALVQYNENPINKSGFYSIPFDSRVEGKKKLLLLGDSFTWGHTSSNKTLSFSNNMLEQGYLLFNTGISGTDVAQYRKILEIYCDSIKPDVVVVNFFLGNDVAYFKRDLKPGLPVHFSTNAGNILAFQAGVQFETRQSAYNNVMKNMIVPQTTIVNKTMSKTVVSTLLWDGLVSAGVIKHEYFVGLQRPKFPQCNEDIEAMMEYCEKREIPFLLSVIPKIDAGVLKRAESVPYLFDSIPHYQPDMTVDMYNSKDGHFNDEGHLFYANYLEELLDSVLSE